MKFEASWKRPEKVLPGEMIAAEEKMYDRLLSEVQPRLAYKEGGLKLNYEYEFSTGEVLSAREDPKGLAMIELQRNGKKLESFNEMAPGYLFITPTYQKRYEKFKEMQGNWGISSAGHILVGDMRSRLDNLSLIHEIGHARDFAAKQRSMMDV